MNRRTRFRIFMRDDFTCQYCGKKAPAVELQVDHVHPRSKGGPDTDANFKTACIDCNRGKHNLVIPRRFLYNGGPKNGESVQRLDEYPAEWIWRSRVNDRLYSLNDATVEDDQLRELAVYGPQWWTRPDSAQVLALRAIAVEGQQAQTAWADGRSMELLGAYLSNGYYPDFDPPGTMDWHTPELALLRLNGNIVVHDETVTAGPRIQDL